MAKLNEIIKWGDEIYRIEENDPVLGGEDGITNKPTKRLANRTQYLRKLLLAAGQNLKPLSLTATTTNTVYSTGHTHSLPHATIAQKGIVQLTDSINNDNSLVAASGKAVRTAFNKGVEGVNKANAAAEDAKNANENANSRISRNGDMINHHLLFDTIDVTKDESLLQPKTGFFIQIKENYLMVIRLAICICKFIAQHTQQVITLRVEFHSILTVQNSIQFFGMRTINYKNPQKF